ncbi:uncharacterized protein LOC143459457 isoform X2 [Clavelina lepadiformis]|uniref:uncharacterized protein LOC143459457 isoform X2 n=1 Tax=Clavelina lepadiformis TaxID=159417 RepID=UPI004041E01B
MENFEWEPEIKKAFDEFQWDSTPVIPNSNTPHVAHFDILSQIGYDNVSVLMELTSPGSNAPKVTKPEPLLPQPKKSSLSARTHVKFLQGLRKFPDFQTLTKSSNPKTLDCSRAMWNEFTILRDIVMKEQREFLNYAFQTALAQISDYNNVSHYAKEYIKTYLAHEVKRISKYFRYYVQHKPIQISVFHHDKDHLPKFVKLSAVMGCSSWVPQLKLPCKVPVYDPSKSISKHRSPISQDPQAKRLAQRWKADIVISMSAIRTLGKNYGSFSDEWEMPMIVQKIEDGSTKKLVVFIDKALPSKSLNGRESCSKYFKKAVKQFVLTSQTTMLADETHEPIHTSNVGVTEKSMDRARVMDASVDLRDKADVNQGDDTEPENFEIHYESLEDSSLLTDEASDICIPQVDGANDKKKSNPKPRRGSHASTLPAVAPRRNTRTKSAPEKRPQVVNASAWQTSFLTPKTSYADSFRSRLPLGSTSSSTFQSWAKKDTIVKDEPVDPSLPLESMIKDDNSNVSQIRNEQQEVADGSSDDTDKGLVIDVDDDKGSSPGQVTFKASTAPMNITESDKKNKVSYEPSDVALTYSVFPSEKSKTSHDHDATAGIEEPCEMQIEEQTALQNRKISQTKPSRTKSKTKTSPVKVCIQSRTKVKKSKETALICISSDEDDLPLAQLTRNKFVTPIKEEQPSSDDCSASAFSTKSSKSGVKLSSKFLVAKAKVSTPSKLTETTNRISSAEIQASSVTNAKAHKNRKTSIKDASKRSFPFTHTNTQENSADKSDVLGQIMGMQKQSSKRLIKDQAEIKITNKTSVENQKLDDISFDDLLEVHSLGEMDESSDLFYNLWSFGKTRVLLRGNLHGKLKTKTNVKTQKSLSPECYATLHTKLEYQTELGFEQLSYAEACSEWMDLNFRPKPSSVVRYRVNPKTEEIVCADFVFPNSSSYLHYESAGFNKMRMTKLLTMLFQKLTDSVMFSPGSYIISHKSKSSEITTRKATGAPTGKQVLYDLHQEYSQPGRFVPSTPNALPWMTLDPIKQLPWQMKLSRIPLTFDIANTDQQTEVPSTKKKKKKNKGRKTKKTKLND